MAHDQRICGSPGADHFLTRDLTFELVELNATRYTINMTSHRWSKRSRKPEEAGQAAVLIVLVLGLFLLGAVAFSVDFGNLWFHRQMAQGVADASCTAAAMDMLYTANGLGSTGGFTAGTPFSCSGSPMAAPCVYATKNMGGAASALTAGKAGYDVAFTFPSTVAGLPACKSGKGAPAICNEPGALTNAFVQVNVGDRVQTYFAGLISGSRTMDVGAQATCGVVLSNSPIPLLVLNPTVSGALSLSGTPNISIWGGPQRSVQVNSSSSSAASGGGSMDLSQGGPNLTGSDFGVYGGPSSACCSFNGGTTGKWIYPASPISDPFAQIPAPAQPTHVGTITSAGYGVNGCPDSGGCDEYSPGYYSGGISVKNATAIFDPGIYYVLGGFSMAANSCAWPSTATGDGSGGSMFYFADSNSISVGANSGKKCTFTPAFNMTSGTGSLQYGVKCTAASSVPANLPATTNGTILLGPCQKPTVSTLCAPNCNINYGDPLGIDDPVGEQRGMLFFQYRGANPAASGDWSGGGQFLLSGNIYIHQCVVGSATGANCTGFNASMGFGGNSGAGNFVVGDIVADQLNMHGTPGIAFDLNPSALFYVFKASLLQ